MHYKKVWWCNTHNRFATVVDEKGKAHCDYKLGGITLPCDPVDITDILEIEEENVTKN